MVAAGYVEIVADVEMVAADDEGMVAAGYDEMVAAGY